MSDPELHPYVWGPALWNVLFTIAFHADPTVSDDVAALLSELRFTLPCRECRSSYTRLYALVRPPPSVLLPEQLPEWLCQRSADSATLWWRAVRSTRGELHSAKRQHRRR